MGTDAIIRLGADLANPNLLAFITESNERSWILSFIGKRKKSQGLYYQIEITTDGPVDNSYISYKKPKKLSKTQKQIFNATQLAKSQDYLRCSKQYNNAALFVTFGKKKYIYVYLIAASNVVGMDVAGGHHRFLIDPRKNKIIQHDPHTKSCLTSKLAADTKLTVVTHLTSKTPNEFHIYMSYLHNMPIYVKTTMNDKLWKVYNGKISIAQDDEDGTVSKIRNHFKKQNNNKEL
ncbi:MAG TPA: hypothetical protein ENJ41_07430 [Oceanospirillales bacterium]|nr:hypothetical protein [Oceanospirillales bacterium]